MKSTLKIKKRIPCYAEMVYNGIQQNIKILEIQAVTDALGGIGTETSAETGRGFFHERKILYPQKFIKGMLDFVCNLKCYYLGAKD